MPARRSPSARATALEVVIAGGGVAALESALALHELAGDLVNVTLLAPTVDFVYRPVAVLEPFTQAAPRRLPLAEFAADVGATLEQGSLAAVDGEHRLLHTQEGNEFHYDALIVAVGARTGEVLPGSLALDVSHMGESLHELIDGIDRGALRRLAFVAPAPAWPLPIYEVALLADERALERGVKLEITIVTAEPKPLAVFGETVSDGVAELLSDSGIETILGARVESSDGKLVVEPGERGLLVDRVVAIPRLQGPAISGLPVDADGFLPITPGCEVPGVERVYAAGDSTDFPVKFGALAAQQADAAAAAIAAMAGAPTPPTPFDGVVHGSLISGRNRSALYFTATLGRGEARDSRISKTPTRAPDAKIAARYLGAYLDRRWAAGPRWVAGQLSWEAALSRLRETSPAPADR